MKAHGYNRYKTGSYLLIGFALLLALAAWLTDPGRYLQSPLLMLSATGFIGGIFLFALDGEPAVSARMASRLSMQGIPVLDRIIREQGCSGPAIILPPGGEGGRVMQFIPARSSCRPLTENRSGLTCYNGNTGILGPPLAGPLLDDLKRDSDLTLPGEEILLMGAVREVCEDLLSVADRVDARREGNSIIFNLHNYLLLPACVALREERDGFCTLCPCSICSLIACMLAEGLNCAVSLHQVTLDGTDRSTCMRLHYTLAAGTGVPN